MSFVSRPAYDWHLRTRLLALGKRTIVMGILNATPDSFSDGGHFYDAAAAPQRAVAHAVAMLEEGADIIDVGGESTRPHATPISADEEQARILPVLHALLRERPQAILSVDTFHAATARAAIEAGAEIVNDVSGLLWDSQMAATCASLQCGTVLMHARGTPQEWGELPSLRHGEIVPMTVDGLEHSLASAVAAGIPRERIVLDPGIGFGKRGEENYAILAQLGQLHRLGLPLLVGASRKGFLAQTLAAAPNLAVVHDGKAPPVNARLNATTAANVAAILAGAHIIRVHDVQAAAEAAAIADQVLAAG
jgi:dihydropteroate synthase